MNRISSIIDYYQGQLYADKAWILIRFSKSTKYENKFQKSRGFSVQSLPHVKLNTNRVKVELRLVNLFLHRHKLCRTLVIFQLTWFEKRSRLVEFEPKSFSLYQSKTLFLFGQPMSSSRISSGCQVKSGAGCMQELRVPRQGTQRDWCLRTYYSLSNI